MSGNHETDFDRRLALAYREPDQEAALRDFVAPTLQELARRERHRRRVLSAASLLGLVITSVTIASFWPQGVLREAGQLSSDVMIAAAQATGFALDQLPAWSAVLAALTVIFVTGATAAVREN